MQARGSRVPPPHCSSPERVEDQEKEEEDRFADSINPLMSFTLEEIANMDKEVEEDMSDQELDASGLVGDIETSKTQRRRRRSGSLDSSNGEIITALWNQLVESLSRVVFFFSICRGSRGERRGANQEKKDWRRRGA